MTTSRRVCQCREIILWAAEGIRSTTFSPVQDDQLHLLAKKVMSMIIILFVIRS